MRTSVLISLGLGLAMGLTACSGEGGESIVISKNVTPGDMCTFAATTSETFNPHGELSLFAKRGYQLFPQLLSRIEATDTQIVQRTIQVQGARVDLAFADTSLNSIMAAGVTHFESRFSAPLLPNGGITDAAFELIPTSVVDAIAAAKGITPATTQSFRTEVIATVTVFGQLAGDDVDSAEYQYPVTICNDCVTNILGTCPLPADTVVVGATNPCNPFQDGTVDCCSSGNSLVCPAVVATAPPP